MGYVAEGGAQVAEFVAPAQRGALALELLALVRRELNLPPIHEITDWWHSFHYLSLLGACRNIYSKCSVNSCLPGRNLCFNASCQLVDKSDTRVHS